MLHSILAFATYLGTALVLLAAFIWAYVNFTPYKEFQLIAQGNGAAAITLGGAILGFTFPIVSSIYYTHSVIEMVLWAVITCLVQFGLFLVIRRYANHIEQGSLAPAIYTASLSIAVGLLNAVSISY